MYNLHVQASKATLSCTFILTPVPFHAILPVALKLYLDFEKNYLFISRDNYFQYNSNKTKIIKGFQL